MNKEITGGRNALHFAADYGQTDVIQCLIDNGADVNVRLLICLSVDTIYCDFYGHKN